LLSPMAHQRYLALIETLGPYTPCRSILDVGCGEGSFTRYLTGQAQTVVGIDASTTAVHRARQLVPRAAFHCSTLESFDSRERFDIVLAVEVLYYVPSVTTALEKLLSIGRTVIVCYTHRERARIERHLDPFCPPERRSVHAFFGLKRHGFTIACLAAARVSV